MIGRFIFRSGRDREYFQKDFPEGEIRLLRKDWDKTKTEKFVLDFIGSLPKNSAISYITKDKPTQFVWMLGEISILLWSWFYFDNTTTNMLIGLFLGLHFAGWIYAKWSDRSPPSLLKATVSHLLVFGLYAIIQAGLGYFVYMYWGLNYFTAAVFQIAIYNFLWTCYHHYLEGDLTKKIFLENLFLALIIIVLVISNTNFKARILNAC
jgi:hypothetical protein